MKFPIHSSTRVMRTIAGMLSLCLTLMFLLTSCAKQGNEQQGQTTEGQTAIESPQTDASENVVQEIPDVPNDETDGEPSEYNLVADEFATPLQQQTADLLEKYGFYVLDVTSLNNELYPNSVSLQGTLGNITALSVAGDAEDAYTAWNTTYQNAMQRGGENDLIMNILHDPNDSSTPYRVEMRINGEYICQDCVNDTYIMLAGEEQSCKTTIQNFFKELNDYDWDTLIGKWTFSAN